MVLYRIAISRSPSAVRDAPITISSRLRRTCSIYLGLPHCLKRATTWPHEGCAYCLYGTLFHFCHGLMTFWLFAPRDLSVFVCHCWRVTAAPLCLLCRCRKTAVTAADLYATVTTLSYSGRAAGPRYCYSWLPNLPLRPTLLLYRCHLWRL